MASLGLSEREQAGCRELLEFLETEELLALTDTVTNRLVHPESRQGARRPGRERCLLLPRPPRPDRLSTPRRGCRGPPLRPRARRLGSLPGREGGSRGLRARPAPLAPGRAGSQRRAGEEASWVGVLERPGGFSAPWRAGCALSGAGLQRTLMKI